MDGIRCVVFDVDDTLYLERDYVRSGCGAVGRWVSTHLGLDGVEELLWAAFERGVRGNLFDVVLEECGIPPERALVKQLITVYREHTPDIELLRDARNALEMLTTRQVAVAVLSDGPLASQQAKVTALGLERWADPVVLTAALGEGFGKPHPAGFQIIERATGHSGGVCAYVADNPSKDFAGPNELGWRTLRIRRPGGLHREVASGPEVGPEIPSLDVLVSALD